MRPSRFTAAIGTVLLLSGVARADVSSAPDVVVFAEPTLRPAIDAVGALFRRRTGAPVRIFAAPSSMLVREIPHTRDDVMILQGRAAIEDAVAGGAADARSRLVIGRNHLVVARRGPGAVLPVAAVIAAGAVAMVDAPVPDGLGALTQTALAEVKWPGDGIRIVGVARSDDATYLLGSGAVSLAVVYTTDVAANSSFSIAAHLPDAEIPIAATAFLSSGAASPNARAFMDFLRSGEAAAGLRDAGLETSAP